MGIKAWSNEEEELLIKLYSSGTKDVYILAEKFNKGHRSVISKLVNLDIYEKPNNKKNDGKTFKAMLREIEEFLEYNIEGMNLNKKSNLELLVIALHELTCADCNSKNLKRVK